MTWIQLQGVVNARDVGGLPTHDGGTTRHGVLLRSDDPHELTEADLAALADLGLTTVIDLRMRVEVDAVGGAALWAGGGVTRVWFDLMPHLAAVDSDSVFTRAVPSEGSGRHAVGNLYAEYVGRAPDSIRGALLAIAEAPGAVLVHCAAGKDRTGVVVALALSLAGVTRAAILADYRRTEERIEAIRDRLLASSFYGPDMAGRSLDSMRARTENLERFLGLIEDEHGDVTNLAQAIGLDAAALARLRERLVEPA